MNQKWIYGFYVIPNLAVIAIQVLSSAYQYIEELFSGEKIVID